MMKTNITKLLFSALFVLAAAPAFSQFSGGLDLGFPNGSWSTFWGTGFGVSVRYEAPIQDKLNWTASAGFLSFSGKSYNFGGFGNITAPSETIIPLTGGIKYYFQESNKGFYGAADIGLFIANNNAGTKFGFSPGVGYRLEKFDFAFRFNAVSDFNYFGLRAAYIFPGK
jgi:hypothetical protein